MEGLHFVLGGCVGEGTQNSDRTVAFNYYYFYFLPSVSMFPRQV